MNLKANTFLRGVCTEANLSVATIFNTQTLAASGATDSGATLYTHIITVVVEHG